MAVARCHRPSWHSSQRTPSHPGVYVLAVFGVFMVPLWLRVSTFFYAVEVPHTTFVVAAQLLHGSPFARGAASLFAAKLLGTAKGGGIGSPSKD